MKKIKYFPLIVVLGLVAITLGGCADNNQGDFKKVTITYPNGIKEQYKKAKVYPYNYNNRAVGIIEVEHNGKATLVPRDAKIDLER